MSLDLDNPPISTTRGFMPVVVLFADVKVGNRKALEHCFRGSYYINKFSARMNAGPVSDAARTCNKFRARKGYLPCSFSPRTLPTMLWAYRLDLNRGNLQSAFHVYGS